MMVTVRTLLCGFLITLAFLNGVAPQIAVAQNTTIRQINVFQIARSGNGQVLGVQYNDVGVASVVDLFDSSSGNLIGTVDLSPYAPKVIALSPTGDRLLFSDANSRLGVHDIATGVTTLILEGGEASIDSIAWNPVSDVVAWTLGSTVDIYDTSTDSFVAVISTSAERIVDLAWSPDGQRLATSHFANDLFDPNVTNVTVKLWNIIPSENILRIPILTIEDRGGGSISWSPDGSKLALLEDGGFAIYDILSKPSVENAGAGQGA